jgi:prepilin-type N-terminal cleavage/methylation domain-containing protein
MQAVDTKSRTSGTRRARRGGFTLVEVAVVMAVVTVAIAMFARTLASSARIDPVAREATVAAEAARSMLEEMRNHPFSEIFRLYNDNPADDPAGPGTAPGSRFAVEGLTPTTSGGFVGRISFPTIGNQIRENSNDEMLGTPRDLNSDGVVDSADHTSDCTILPTRVRLEWASRSGQARPRQFELYTMFARL